MLFGSLINSAFFSVEEETILLQQLVFKLTSQLINNIQGALVKPTKISFNSYYIVHKDNKILYSKLINRKLKTFNISMEREMSKDVFIPIVNLLV